MNSSILLEYMSSAPDMTVSIEQLLANFKEKNANSFHGVIFGLRRKGYKITSPEKGHYKLLSLEPQSTPFSSGKKVGNRYTEAKIGIGNKTEVKQYVSPKQNSIENKFNTSALKVPKNCSILSPEDKEDYLRLAKQSIYYGMCAEALLKANELQMALRKEIENA